jgi:hypothetical protein
VRIHFTNYARRDENEDEGDDGSVVCEANDNAAAPAHLLNFNSSSESDSEYENDDSSDNEDVCPDDDS